MENKLIFLSGASRMGKSTLSDRILREFPEYSFHYLSHDAVKDMIVDCNIADEKYMKISHSFGLKSGEEFVEASQVRDKIMQPFFSSWVNSEMSRGHNCILNTFVDPDITYFYKRENTVPIVFLDLRSEVELYNHYKSIIDSDDCNFNWMRKVFDDDSLKIFSRSSQYRLERAVIKCINNKIPFMLFGDYDCDFNKMHDYALELIEDFLLNDKLPSPVTKRSDLDNIYRKIEECKKDTFDLD